MGFLISGFLGFLFSIGFLGFSRGFLVVFLFFYGFSSRFLKGKEVFYGLSKGFLCFLRFSSDFLGFSIIAISILKWLWAQKPGYLVKTQLKPPQRGSPKASNNHQTTSKTQRFIFFCIPTPNNTLLKITFPKRLSFYPLRHITSPPGPPRRPRRRSHGCGGWAKGSSLAGDSWDEKSGSQRSFGEQKNTIFLLFFELKDVLLDVFLSFFVLVCFFFFG